MSGIEQAFKDFVKRVSEKENQEQVSEERGYQYGGGGPGLSLTRQKEFEDLKQSIKLKTNEEYFLEYLLL